MTEEQLKSLLKHNRRIENLLLRTIVVLVLIAVFIFIFKSGVVGMALFIGCPIVLGGVWNGVHKKFLNELKWFTDMIDTLRLENTLYQKEANV